MSNQPEMGISDIMVVFIKEDNEMTKRIPMKGGDEYDGLTKARKFLLWKSGQLKKIKRAYNKRFRKHIKEVNDE
jgi:hypothetical protein